jgi:flagellar biosynthesis/type III secretory pathway M-ring protein FliF/YscJ
MDPLRRALATIQTNLGKLSTSHKLLIGSLVVIVVMGLFLISRYTGEPAMAEVLPGATATDQQRAGTHLATVGIKYQFRDGKLFVSTADVSRVRSMLAEAGQLPADSTILFENIISHQKWTNSRQQNEQIYNLALQNEVARMITGFKGVKAAKVMIDIPEAQGLGRAVRAPTAVATVTTENGQAMPQSMVDAVSALVASSRAGLSIVRVRVIDAATGRQCRASNEDQASSSSYLEHAAKVEAQTREKILDLLAYIPGVVVAVTAQVDVTRVTAQVNTHMPEKQGTVSLPRRTTETTTSSNEVSPAAEPGVGANQTADINRSASAAGSRTDSNDTMMEYENHVGSRSETIVDPKGHPTFVAVSVNVPRSFVVAQMKPAAGGTAPTDPAEADIKTKFESDVKPAILASLAPQVRALTGLASPGATAEQISEMLKESIGVAMIPLDVRLPEAPQEAGVLGGLTSGGLSLGGGIFDKAVLGLLSVAAMAMMVMMVRKAGKQATTPTAEELVGLPPTLEAQADVIGEAEESDTAMTGIEVGEDEMQSQKMLEQVEELVDQSPEAAAKLINRWINVDE